MTDHSQSRQPCDGHIACVLAGHAVGFQNVLLERKGCLSKSQMYHLFAAVQALLHTLIDFQRG